MTVTKDKHQDTRNKRAITKRATSLLLLGILGAQRHITECSAETTCAAGTSLDPESDSCRCDNSTCGTSVQPADNGKVYIAGLFDTTNFDWGEEIFNLVVDMINDRSDGWHDELFPDGAVVEASIADAGCDPESATREYWSLKNDWGEPLHGVVGCRCTGASMAVARIAGLEGVTQVSMSSTSSKLSNVKNFPSFFRVVSPDDHRGQVGALVMLLRSFEWGRVSILSTDTQYTKDLATAFSKEWVGSHKDSSGSWTGQVAYTHTIGLTQDGAVDEESVKRALEGVPTDDPTVNSRVILLFAHDQHTYQITKQAQQEGFQPDTIWVGPQAWANRLPDDQTWMPSIPGYLGVVPHVSTSSPEYKDFLSRLQAAQRAAGRDEDRVTKVLPDYAAAMTVDSLLSLATALSSVAPESRGEGQAVVAALRNVSLAGVSGEVQFTADGDRANPVFDVVNLPSKDGGWRKVGTVTPNTANVDVRSICWAEAGCNLDVAPLDTYPEPPDELPVWVLVVIPAIAVLVVALGIKYWRSHQKKKSLKKNVDELQSRIDAMKNIDDELEGLGKTVEDAKARQDSLIQKRFDLQDLPPTWTSTEDTLVEVPPEDEQYWDVTDRLRETMSDAWVSKIWRVQNKSLWTFYSFHKDRLEMNGIDHNERQVWHGTSTLDPTIIYSDRQDGFMMQFSSQGYWGRGVYFADKSAYSCSYSHKPGASCTERPAGAEGEREMFLAKLLVGNEILMNRDESDAKKIECRNLTVPPTDARTGLKYNTVTGHTAGSQVWIVYENGRAYPDYLVRYYKGNRNINRTPYKSKEEAIQPKPEPQESFLGSLFSSFSATPDADPELGLSQLAGPAVWMYYDNGWRPYNPAAQAMIESAHQTFTSSQGKGQSKVQVTSGTWTYEVDVDAMVQKNTTHPNHTERKIMRQTAQLA